MGTSDSGTSASSTSPVPVDLATLQTQPSEPTGAGELRLPLMASFGVSTLDAALNTPE